MNFTNYIKIENEKHTRLFLSQNFSFAELKSLALLYVHLADRGSNPSLCVILNLFRVGFNQMQYMKVKIDQKKSKACVKKRTCAQTRQKYFSLSPYNFYCVCRKIETLSVLLTLSQI